MPQTETQRQAAFAAAGVNPASLPPAQPVPPISVADMANPQKPLNVTTPAPLGIPSTAGIGVPTAPTTPTTPAPANDFIARLDQLTSSKAGQEADSAAALETAIAPAEQALNQINTEIATRQALALERQEKARATGDTLGFAAGEAERVARTDAIELIKLSALQAGAQGNLALATKRAETAIKAKYAQIDRDIETAKANIYNNWDSLDDKEKRRARATLLRLDKDDAFVKQQQADEALIFQTANIALANGADLATVQKMYDAATPQEAVEIGQKFMRDPKAVYELENARLDTVLKKAEIAYKQKATALLGQPTAEEKKKQAQDMKDAKARVPVLQSKVTLIDSLLGNKSAMNVVVGPSRLAREGSLFPGIPFLNRIKSPEGILQYGSGNAQDFIGGVSQLVSQEFLDSLLSLKSQGGSLGQVTEKEGQKLQEAATKLGSWEMRDKNNQVTGYNVSEAAFQAELTKIREATNAILAESRGTLFDEEESSVLDQIYKTPNFNAINFY